ncbi:helix-turn-helix domain-containing protein [Streptococcus suis]|uniref:Transcription regulator n=2 Tax=Streptococcus suis TaxID=1307 RepID=A0A0Z8N8G3_STRSU|nr:helix-turn-helix transcriptional regulator [Streptococcus suis]MCE6986876.1 helix-turn-helix domain-containing protein [Streptococcus suis]CYW22788.1 transcription regulator [Streptococcus suis]
MKWTLKMLRARDNLTQKQAGKLVGVTADTWASWENQKTFPDVQKIIEIEKAFNVNYDDINFLG